jgi:hypothetical protein
VTVHDLVMHPRDFVICTHGGSIYVMPIGPLDELTPAVLAEAPAKSATITIFNPTGVQGSTQTGLHQVLWGLRGKGETVTVRPRDYRPLLQFGNELLLSKVHVDGE